MKTKILNTIEDLVSDFVYYGIKDDNELTVKKLNKSVESGEITVDEMVSEFRKHLENVFKK